MRSRSGYHLQAYAYIAPFDRLLDAPNWAHAFGVIGSVLTYLVTDLFTSALFLIAASGCVDYMLGIRIAKARKVYDPAIAHAGVISKISGIAIMMLARMAEYWMMNAGVVNTRGMIAAGLTLSLFAVDLDGIQAKREQLGARPIPGLSKFTHFLNSIIERGLPSTAPVREERAQRADQVE